MSSNTRTDSDNIRNEKNKTKTKQKPYTKTRQKGGPKIGPFTEFVGIAARAKQKALVGVTAGSASRSKAC